MSAALFYVFLKLTFEAKFSMPSWSTQTWAHAWRCAGSYPNTTRTVLSADRQISGWYCSNAHVCRVFIVTDYASRFQEAAAQIFQWLKEGKLKYRLDLVEGLQAAPTALSKLFEGSNTGKLLVKISEEPS